AKMVLINTIGQLNFGGSIGKLAQYFHSGGIIRRAHDGMLASDEVPIIAQTGEAILSRSAVSNLGADNVNRLNSGQGINNGGGSSGSVVVNITPVISLWSAADVKQHEQEITNIVGLSIMNNAYLRTLINQYGK